MNDDFSELWQSQTTGGTRISLEEVRNRLQRLKERTKRTSIIAITAAVGNLLLIVVDDVFFFEKPLGVWFKAAQIVSWIIWCRYLGRTVIPAPGRILSLNLGARSTPCLNFYRQQLQAHRNSLLQGRGVTFGAGIVGVCLIALASVYRIGRHPEVFMPLGLVLTVGGFLWYLLLRREHPKIQTELEELEAFSGVDSVANR